MVVVGVRAYGDVNSNWPHWGGCSWLHLSRGGEPSAVRTGGYPQKMQVGSRSISVEEGFDSMRGSQWLAGVEAKISVAPVQGPSLVSGGVAQSGDRKARPFWPEVLTPGGAPLDDREMSWGDLAFDTDLVAGMLGHPHGAPPLHLCDIQLGQCRTIEPSALQLLAKELCCGTWSAWWLGAWVRLDFEGAPQIREGLRSPLTNERTRSIK